MCTKAPTYSIPHKSLHNIRLEPSLTPCIPISSRLLWQHPPPDRTQPSQTGCRLLLLTIRAALTARSCGLEICPMGGQCGSETRWAGWLHGLATCWMDGRSSVNCWTDKQRGLVIGRTTGKLGLVTFWMDKWVLAVYWTDRQHGLAVCWITGQLGLEICCH